MFINFIRKHYSGIIPFVCEGKVEIHKYMQHEVSTTVCMGRIANQRKVPKWLLFKNYKSESLNIRCAYMRDINAYAGVDPGFPVGGVDLFWGGHGPQTQMLFSENVCENNRIGSHGGRVSENFVCRTANDRCTKYDVCLTL